MSDDESIGLRRGHVCVVPYDPAWAAAFTAEATRLAHAIARAGLPPLAFEHIGSTAVPGLAAKPIIDFMGGYPAGAASELYTPVLLGSGYTARGAQGVPERALFVLGAEARRTHHLNLVAWAGAFWRANLSFRDRLRAEPELRLAYAELKARLARAHPEDRGAYTAGKAAFIAQGTAEQPLPPAN